MKHSRHIIKVPPDLKYLKIFNTFWNDDIDDATTVPPFDKSLIKQYSRLSYLQGFDTFENGISYNAVFRFHIEDVNSLSTFWYGLI